MIKLTNMENDKPFYILKPSSVEGFGIVSYSKGNTEMVDCTRIGFGNFNLMVKETPEQILKLMRPKRKKT